MESKDLAAVQPELVAELDSALRHRLLQFEVITPADGSSLPECDCIFPNFGEFWRALTRSTAEEPGVHALDPATAARLRAVSMHDVVQMAEQVFREEGRAEYVVRGKRTA